ncbi:leukocyte immunoglobulin-like receptor subfamily A member 6 [Erinaceus europaeus]|uniref:Leukocyte immunoglobulin-like receptor subfamily A member 6 n=1 Tax=Erinaceus europaeus TaxID=9365 RepID=A0ABM3X0Z6_ERIEU|nr:leukocyte immunoglobulin-like receptor subfamily A member 6 [Erinaceus europaeus]
MADQQAGIYRCLYLISSDWSQLSDPLELVVVSGSYSKPSLSALPSPVVTPGGTMTLQCASGQRFERMGLTQQGEDTSPWTLDTQPHPSGQVQALFHVGPVTPSHRGTFRCHGYYRSRPQVWSPPSEPLELLVSAPVTVTVTVHREGETGRPGDEDGPSVKDGTGHQGPPIPHPALIGVPVALVLLLSLFLCLLLRGWCQRKLSKAESDPRPEDGAQLDPQVSPCSHQNKDPPVPNLKAAASTAPQDVTYAQLTLRQWTAPPSSRSDVPPKEPSLGGRGAQDGELCRETGPEGQEGPGCSQREEESAAQTEKSMRHSDLGAEYADLSLQAASLSPLTTGTLPKPTLWAEPGPVVPWRSPVTLWCQGTLGAQEFHLHKEQSPAPWDRQIPLESGDKAKFPITYMAEQQAGIYRCLYLISSDWSELSDPLELVVVSGFYSKPSLSALPSPVVTTGGTVTLQCASEQRFDRMVLTQQGEDTSPWTLDTQPHPGQVQALFHVGPMSPSHRWAFRCHGYYRSRPQVWSPPSEPLELLVSGAAESPSPIQNKPSSENVAAPQPQDHRVENLIRMGVAALVLLALWVLLWEAWHSQRSTQGAATSRRDPRGAQVPSSVENPRTHDPFRTSVPTPSLSAHPSPVVEAGVKLTLSCSSETASGTFHLLKEGGADPPLHVEQRPSPGRPQVLFHMGPLNTSHGGTYRCYGSSSSYPQQWSEPSDPLHLEVFQAPYLVAHTGQLVLFGDGLTLQCCSWAGFDTFALATVMSLRVPVAGWAAQP